MTTCGDASPSRALKQRAPCRPLIGQLMADDRNTFDPARLADWKRKSPAPWTPGFAFAAGADGWARPEASPISPAGRSDPYIPRKATSLRDCGAAASRRKLAPQPLPAAI